MLEGMGVFLSFKPINTLLHGGIVKLSSIHYQIKGNTKGVITCQYCFKIRNKSKNHKTRHALLCHISVEHKDDIKIWGNLHGN